MLGCLDFSLVGDRGVDRRDFFLRYIFDLVGALGPWCSSLIFSFLLLRGVGQNEVRRQKTRLLRMQEHGPSPCFALRSPFLEHRESFVFVSQDSSLYISREHALASFTPLLST